MNDGNSTEPQDNLWTPQQPANDDGAAPEAAAASPTDRVAELEAEVAKYKDQALRALAEAENVRRRAERERDDAAKYGVSQIAKDLLPVADNLRRALEHIDEKEKTENATLAGLVGGLEATERELFTALERRNIKKIEPIGEKFDPNFHQAMYEVPTDEHPPGTVVQMLQAGYVIHDRLLRPALVGVAKAAGGDAPRVNTQA